MDWRAFHSITEERHIAYYLVHCEAHSKPRSEDYDALEKDLPNIFRAIEQARVSEDWSAIIRMVYVLLGGCLRVRGYWGKSVKCGYALAEAAVQVGDKRAEGWAWTSAVGWIIIQQGHYVDGRKAVERGLQAFDEAGSEWGGWQARRYLGHAYHASGNWDKARTVYLSALRDANAAYSDRHLTLSLLKRYVRFVRRNWRRGNWTWNAFIATRKADYHAIVAHYYNDLGNLALDQGKLDQARMYYEQALTRFSQLGREMEMGIVLNGLAHVAREQRALDEARYLYLQSLEINQRFGRKLSVAEAHLGLAEIEFAQGNEEKAQQLKKTAKDTYQSLGISN